MSKKLVEIYNPILAITMMLILASVGTAMATVWTDQLDYAPGSVVTISGNNSDHAGYLAGETVNVSVNGPYNYDSSCSSIVDPSGTWSCHVILSSDYTAEGSYTYTAVGQTSHVNQTGTFTDAASNVNFNTNGLPDGISISVTGSGTNNGGHSISGPWVFNSPGGTSTNMGVLTGSQFTYSFPASVSDVNGVKYNLQSSTPQSPFTIVTGINSVTATYALADNMPPTIVVPADINAEATSSAGASVSYSVTATDNIGVTSGPTCSPTSGSTFSLGTTTVSCTASDASGNIGSASFKVTVHDTTPPLIKVPVDVTKEATGALTTVTLGTASATDLVDGAVTVTNDAPASFPVGTTTVTYTATDSHGNTATKAQKVTITDITPPTITAPTDITKEATAAKTSVTLGIATATDTADPSPTVTNNAPTDGFPVGITTVTWTATDHSGNKATADQTVTITDTTPPTIIVPADVNAEATGSKTTVDLGTASATDIVDSTVAVSNDAPTDGFPVGVTTVTYTATDSHGNTATATQRVTITDTTPPIITGISDVSAEATGPKTSPSLGTATATDLVDGSVIVTNNAPTNGFPVGETTITYTATDNHGNTATATQTVTITDKTPPTITVPADVSAEATGPTGAVVTFATTATDIVDGSITPTCTPASGSTFALGSSTVTCSATDAHGNTGSKTFTVTVKDTTPPTIETHADVPAEAMSASGAVVSYTSPATHDVVDGDSTATCAPASGSTFALGDTIVTCNAQDKAGNAAAPITFKVTVKDTTAPTITSVPKDITMEATGPTTAVSLGTATATDLVDPEPVVTNDAPTGGFTVGTTTVTWTATDASGNKATATQTVIITDSTPPAITVPASITKEATGSTTAVSLGTATATDIVDGDVAVTNDAPASFPVGVTTVTYTATDSHGNKATTTQTVTITDKTPPTITVPADVSAVATGPTTTVSLGTATATDIVDGTVAVTNDASSGGFPVGTTIVTWTATDSHGNKATATQKVTITYSKTNGESVLPPLEQVDSYSKLTKEYKLGSTLPFKFQLYYANNVPVETAKPTLTLYMVSKSVDLGDQLVDLGTSSSDSGMVFRYDPTAQQYIYNLKTTGLSTGSATFKAVITLDDDTSFLTYFQLRK